MTEFEIVKHIMMVNSITYDSLSERLGYKSKSTSYTTLNGKHIYTDTLRKYLEELGYELVIRKKDGNGQEYIVSDDCLPSPLRFHDMSLDLDAVIEGKPRSHTNQYSQLTVGERNALSEALKYKLQELTFEDCDQELRKIWSIDTSTDKKNKYDAEYNKYRKQFAEIYRITDIVSDS